MELAQRLTGGEAPARPTGWRDPFWEVKDRIHKAVISGPGPQLFNTETDTATLRGRVSSDVAAHLATEQFIEIANLITSNDHVAARTIWSSLQGFIPRLFQEANPMPIKYCLWRQGLIHSPECRLPLSSISEALAGELDHWIKKATTLSRAATIMLVSEPWATPT